MYEEDLGSINSLVPPSDSLNEIIMAHQLATSMIPQKSDPIINKESAIAGMISDDQDHRGKYRPND